MNRFRNSIFTQTALWLLTGYFLVSGLNLNTGNLGFNTRKGDIHCLETVWKKMLKTFKVCCESEKSAEKESKPVKNSISPDYMIPAEAHLLAGFHRHDSRIRENRSCFGMPQAIGSKIPLPPPEVQSNPE